MTSGGGVQQIGDSGDIPTATGCCCRLWVQASGDQMPPSPHHHVNNLQDCCLDGPVVVQSSSNYARPPHWTLAGGGHPSGKDWRGRTIGDLSWLCSVSGVQAASVRPPDPPKSAPFIKTSRSFGTETRLPSSDPLSGFNDYRTEVPFSDIGLWSKGLRTAYTHGVSQEDEMIY